MNNFDWITNQKDLEKLGHDLCWFTNLEVMDCDCCPVKNKCKVGTNGYIEWLKEEHEGN